MTWVPVASESDTAPGTATVVAAGDQRIALCRTAEGCYAIADVCTHDGGSLDQGELDGNEIECPRHGARFDVTSGRALTLPAVRPVKTYPTRIANGMIEVELPRGVTSPEAVMFNVSHVREDFPILHRMVNGRPLVYLDNAATTQKPRQVIDAITRFYEQSNANIHRGIHTLSVEATEQYEAVRAKAATHIGTPAASEIVFTRNTTEAINLVARTWGDANLDEGDEIVLSLMEHHSNIVPWQLLSRRTGAVLRYADILDDGTLDMDSLRAVLSPRTKLVSVTQMSNVLGTINPIAEIAEAARSVGALLLVDGAQGAPHLPIDVHALGCDFYAFSAHKMLGPTGVGVLWARTALLQEMDPFLGGGEMISVVRTDESSWADLPHKFEAGTPNIADVVAFGAALDYLQALGMGNVRAHEEQITAYAIDALLKNDDTQIHGPLDITRRGGAVSFSIDGLHPHDISTVVDQYGVAIRAGHHCAQLLMRRLAVPATTRASFYIYTTTGEIDALVEALDGARKVFANGDTRAAV